MVHGVSFEVVAGLAKSLLRPAFGSRSADATCHRPAVRAYPTGQSSLADELIEPVPKAFKAAAVAAGTP